MAIMYNLSSILTCGPSEIRTRDLLDAIEARYQLRHGPEG